MERDYNVWESTPPCQSQANKHPPRQGAVTALNTLQSNFAIVDAIRKSGRGMNQQAIPEMIDWYRKIGYEVRPVS